MLLPHGCIVALIDGESFDVYRNAGSEAEPQLLLLDPPQIDSSNHSDVGHRSSPGNHADRRVDEDAHAKAAAEWLNSQVQVNRIKDLVVLADPRSLGEMRKHYHSRTRDILRKEVAKDLTGFHPHDIMLALRENR
ncbi:MAG: hypothetical protein RL339_2682 [Pseudomonadota bacterium]|jgi:protein required for attachment to host cells